MIEKLRAQLADLDSEILELIQKRSQIVDQISEAKEEKNPFCPDIEYRKRKSISGLYSDNTLLNASQSFLIALGRVQQTDLQIACMRENLDAFFLLMGPFLKPEVFDSLDEALELSLSANESCLFVEREELKHLAPASLSDKVQYYLIQNQLGELMVYPVY